MSTNDIRRSRSRTMPRRIGAGLVAAGIGISMFLPATAQAAEPSTGGRGTPSDAQSGYAGRTPPPQTAEVDLFRLFTDCLSKAAGPDSMYPCTNPQEVNDCLERWGVL